MAQIPVERQTPLGHMDAPEVLRRRLPPEPAPALEVGQSAKTIYNLPAGQTVQLASLQSPIPRLFAVHANVQSLGSAAGYFEVRWSMGGAEGVPIRFQSSGPFTITATAVALLVVNPTNFALTPVVIQGSVSFAPGPFGPARPLWVDPANNLAVNINAAATATFNLSRYTRRVRVGRATIATPFTTADVITIAVLAGTLQQIAANADFAWREIVTPQIQVTNNAAVADAFTVYEELNL